MAHSTTRAERMKSLSNAELRRIIEGKTLRSAAARFELTRRIEEADAKDEVLQRMRKEILDKGSPKK